MMNKLNVDIGPYKILGACNPPFAYKALQAERNIGLYLPCNVVVQEAGEGKTEVAAVDPLVAEEIRTRLQRVIEAL